MKKFLLILVISSSLNCTSQPNFDNMFHEKSMRVDFILAGNSETENAFIHEIKEEPYWAGAKNSLIDPFGYGEYKFEVVDIETNNKIFSMGFCTFFEEWQTTEEAKHMNCSFYETVVFPYPKKEFYLVIYSRSWEGSFKELLKTKIDPNSYLIKKGNNYTFDTEKLIDNGETQDCLDIAFLAEGYTIDEMDKFNKDVIRMSEFLFKSKPFDKYTEKINVWAVKSISEESGTDVPGENIWKNTILNSSFYTFDIPRYLTTQDYKAVRDVASLVPYDVIYVIVNTERYGGGGIYNHYNLGSTDHYLSEKVFVHEFGHGLAGLADEYFGSTVAYEDFINVETEPWQPNITSLKNFEAKWKDMVQTDSIPSKTVAENEKKIGVYEGAAYMSKGLYRPYINCRMRTNEAEGFCPVCQKAIIKVLNYYCK